MKTDVLYRTWKLNQKISCWEAVDLAKDIHYQIEDFWEGDLVERIKRFAYYVLQEVPISLLDRGTYYIDGDLVKEYAEMPKESTPPIILGEQYMGEYDVVDGNHRVESYALKGYETILALVPVYESRLEEVEEVEEIDEDD